MKVCERGNFIQLKGIQKGYVSCDDDYNLTKLIKKPKPYITLSCDKIQ